MEENKEEIQKLNTSKDIVNYVKEKTSNSQDMVYRTVQILDSTIYVIYNEAMTATALISDFVIRSIKSINYEDVKSEALDNIQNNLDTYIDDSLNVDNTRIMKRQRVYDNLNKKNKNLKLTIEDIVDKLEENIDISKVKKLDL